MHNSHVTKQQIVIGLCVATFSVRAADPKGYQVTGPVLEINANHIVVQKGEQKWQIAVDKSTKGANVKVGDKVTVYYSMTATEIEAKAGLDFFKPVKPDTIAKSLAIGTPADGFYALKVMKDTGAAADDVTDDEIRDAIKLLAETEGIFAETAGGVTVGVAQKLIAAGKIPRNDSAVLCVTGNGLKTLDAVAGHVGKPREIKPSRREFEALLANEEKVNA